MQTLLTEIERWRNEGKSVAIATVVKVYGSAPRPLGSKMAVSLSGNMVGSVSGGCVEGAVFEEAYIVMQQGQPKLIAYGITDELAALTVGLACGGTIEVFVEPLTGYELLRDGLQQGQLVAVATVIAGAALGQKLFIWADGRMAGTIGSNELTEQVRQYSVTLLAKQHHGRAHFTVGAETAELFVEVYPPPQKLMIIGAVHIAISLSTFAKSLGFQTIVIDPRGMFATRERFPQVDKLLVAWPDEVMADLHLDEATYIVTLTHDEKIDNPALQVALNSPARYIGALGSRVTHAKRLVALREMGVAEHQFSRLHAPIGLDIGASGPEEIAISIIAEIVAARRGN